MKQTKSAAFGLIAVLVFIPFSVMAESGLILAGSVGSSTLDDNIDGFGIDTNTTAFRLTAGWQFSDLFALEGGYHSFGDFDERFDIGGIFTLVGIEADGYTFGATMSLPVGHNFSLFGRGGAFIWDAETRIDGLRLSLPEDTNAYYGGGADFEITDRLSLVGDWTRYELEGPDSDVISIGIKLRF